MLVNRSALKPLTYGMMHLVVAIGVALAITRNWQAALAVGLVEPFLQTIAYALHERAWAGTSARSAPRVAHAH